jgi:hypothetical protein
MPDETLHTQFSVIETEDTITIGRREFDNYFRNRLDYDRQKVLEQAIKAWRTNPLARRIVEITTQFVVGDGITFDCKQPRAKKFLDDFWDHPLNNIPEQMSEWADECWRGGDLFMMFSVDDTGMSYVRAVPAELITEIETAAQDYRQETFYRVSNFENDIPAYAPGMEQKSFIIHFALNRAAGAYFGESDLAPVLYWIGLYKQWLEDRARLNYFRQLFAYFVQKPWKSEEEKNAYRAKLAGNPPKPGSINLIDPDEMWGIINPNLASFEAEIDGLAIKRMIAAGVGMPLHFLAEPESSTKSTAEAAGTPTYKRFEARQLFFCNALKRILEVALDIRRQYDSRLPKDAEIEILSPDISERDNAGLAVAASSMGPLAKDLHEQGLIDAKEYVRLVYQFAGQTAPEVPENPVPRTVASPANSSGTAPNQNKSKTNINDQGDVTVKAEENV